MYYNKDMFEEYGLEVPTTRDEFFKVCDTFMEAGIYPMVHPYNFIHGVFHEMDAFFTSMAAATGNEHLIKMPEILQWIRHREFRILQQDNVQCISMADG